MGIVTIEEETSSQVAAPRLFRALILDNHNLVPKLAPQHIKSAVVLQGDGGAGTIKQVNFQDDAPFKYLKYKVDELDEANLVYKYTLIEGGELDEVVKSIKFETKFEPSADGGCVSKLKRVVEVADGAELKPDEVEAHKARSKMMFDAVEAYLLQNPGAYA